MGKLRNSQFWEFQDSNLGVLEQNDIWMLAPWLGTKNTIRGKVVASPQVQVIVSFVNSCLLMAYPCTKLFPLRTNQCVVWFV
jgi:hypothetical protein